MSSNTKHILVMGVKEGPDPAANNNEWSAQQILDAVKKQFVIAKEAGFEMQIYSVDLNKSQEIIMEEIRDKLRKQHWDGVSIGFGLRGFESNTPLFEKIVNLVVEEKQQSPPKFVFALRPNTVWEAVARVFGVEQEQ